MGDLTTFRYNVLAVLYRDGPLHGLGIKAELEDRYDTEVGHGQLYPNLDSLVKSGYVDKSERDRRTNEYALTDAGKVALQERVEDLGGSVRHMGAEPSQVPADADRDDHGEAVFSEDDE